MIASNPSPTAPCRWLAPILVVLCAAVAAAEDVEPLTVELGRVVHFSGPDGAAVSAPAGRYLVEAGDGRLVLHPADGAALVVGAEPGSHDAEGLAQAFASSVSGEGELADVHILAVSFPGGITLEATGSYTGVAERGLLSKAKRAASKTRKKVSSSTSAAAKRAKAAAAKAKADAARKKAETARAAAAAKAAAEAEAARKAKQAAEAAAQAQAATQQGAQVAGAVIVDTAQGVGEAVAGAGQAVGAAAQQGFEDFKDAAGNALSEADRLRRQAVCRAQSKSLEAWSSGQVGGGSAAFPIRDLILKQASKPENRQAFIDLADAFAQRFAPEIAEYGSIAEVLNRPGNRERIERVLSASNFCENPADAVRDEIRNVLGRPLPDDFGTRGEGTGIGWSIQLQGALEGVLGIHGGHGVAFRKGVRGNWITWLGGHLASDVGVEVVLQAGFWPGLDPDELAGTYFGIGAGGSIGSPVGFAAGIDFFFDKDPFTSDGFWTNPVTGRTELRPDWVAEHFTGLTVTPFTGASAGVMPAEVQVEGGITATVLGF